MLRIKYIDAFKNNLPCLIITGDNESFSKAYEFFKDKPWAFLDDDAIVEKVEVGALAKEALFLTSYECGKIAEHFRNLAASEEPRHAYFDSEALGEAEIIISMGEYDSLV